VGYKIEQERSTQQQNIPWDLVALFLLMTALAYFVRLFLSESILILYNSIFLFRFLLGALVVISYKYILGINTYGLFGPTIIVISMLAIGPFWGMIIFLNVFIIGYIVRYLINDFNLAVGFRIAIIMTFIISFITLLELLGEIFLIPFLSTSILVPILITPWFVDHFFRDVEEKDHFEAFKRLVLTLIVSVSAYFLMSLDPLVQFIVLNPETWIVFLAVFLYFGRNQKYTLFDKKRFKLLFKHEDEPLTMMIRNRDYIARYNSKILFSYINKFHMKDQFNKWEVPTPLLLAVISSEREVNDIIFRLMYGDIFENGFVIKPSQSLGGRGIKVVKSRTKNDHFVTSSSILTVKQLRKEIIKILNGEYLTSQTKTSKDIVLIEERIVSDTKLSSISIGLADIRVIVFKGIPVMAMARLPTKDSDGKANLKQGAIGAAISLVTGEITNAQWKGHDLTSHPDTGNTIIGYRFDNWNEILAVACLAQKSSGLGYAGVDIVLSDDGRILVLEVNKRPGLEIQNVNHASLLRRFSYIEKEDLDCQQKSPIQSASFGIELARKVWENTQES